MLVGMYIDSATMETGWMFLKKLKKELPFDPAITLLGMCPKEMETGY